MTVPQNTIRVVVCVPYSMTSVCIVRKYQKISVIMKVFPNIKNIDDIILWYNGAQMIPQLNFDDVGIQDKSTIVVGIKTDDISINRFWIWMSKFSQDTEFFNKIINKINRNTITAKKNRIVENRINDMIDEKKYHFIQKIKSINSQIDFSKRKVEDSSESNIPLPGPCPDIC